MRVGRPAKKSFHPIEKPRSGGVFGWLFVSKRLDHGSNHPTKPLRALARTPVGRDDTALGFGVICFNDILSHLYQLYFPIYILLILSILLSAFYNPPFHLS